MTPTRRQQLSRLKGTTPDGRRLSLNWTEKGSSGEQYCLQHLDPLADKIGVDRESLRGWYNECIRDGLPSVHVPNGWKNGQEEYWEKVGQAAKVAPNKEAFSKRWEELAARERARKERRIDPIRNVLFLQVRSGELATWWPKYALHLVGSGEFDKRWPTIVAVSVAEGTPLSDPQILQKSMYGVEIFANRFGYGEWLAPRRAFMPAYDLPPGIVVDQWRLFLIGQLAAGFAPLPWELPTRRQ